MPPAKKHTSATRLLKQAAKGDTPLASFARWSVQAFDTEAVGAALDEKSRAPGQPALGTESERARRQEIAADCAMLWAACRRTAPSARGELIATLRENAPVWEAHLRSYLQSPNPRDRVLALHVISARPLAHRFRTEIEPLRDDPLEGIRRLARRLMQMLAQEPAPDVGPAACAPQTAPPDLQAVERARHELRATLERLGSGEADATDSDLMARVRDLLREVYAGQLELQPVASLGEEG